MRTRARLTFVLATAMVPAAVFAGTAQALTTVALWHMDSAAQMVDSSGHGNNGRTSNITVVGGGYRFGAGSSVTVPDSASLDPGGGTIRITAHVKFTVPPSTAVGDYDLIRKGVAGTAGGDWKMEIFPGGGSAAPAFCLFQDTAHHTASVRGTANLADGRPHTIVCLKTGSAVSVIVDGTARSVGANLGPINNAQPVVLGQKPGGGDQYRGDMDEVSIQIG